MLTMSVVCGLSHRSSALRSGFRTKPLAASCRQCWQHCVLLPISKARPSAPVHASCRLPTPAAGRRPAAARLPLHAVASAASAWDRGIPAGARREPVECALAQQVRNEHHVPAAKNGREKKRTTLYPSSPLRLRRRQRGRHRVPPFCGVRCSLRDTKPTSLPAVAAATFSFASGRR